MIAVDSSSFIAFLSGDDLAADAQAVDHAIVSATLYLPPVVITELLSDPAISAQAETVIMELPVLGILPGFWARAAKTRAILLKLNFKAKLADAFIAQSCIDYHVPLITRDKDFRHYSKHCGLKLHHA